MSNFYYSRSHIPESDSISIESHSSVSTNATEPNLVGTGRTLGLVIDKAYKRPWHRHVEVLPMTDEEEEIARRVQKHILDHTSQGRRHKHTTR